MKTTRYNKLLLLNLFFVLLIAWSSLIRNKCQVSQILWDSCGNISRIWIFWGDLLDFLHVFYHSPEAVGWFFRILSEMAWTRWVFFLFFGSVLLDFWWRGRRRRKKKGKFAVVSWDDLWIIFRLCAPLGRSKSMGWCENAMSQREPSSRILWNRWETFCCYNRSEHRYRCYTSTTRATPSLSTQTSLSFSLCINTSTIIHVTRTKTDGCIDGWMDGGTKGWRDGWIEEWRNRGTEEWMHGGMFFLPIFPSLVDRINWCCVYSAAASNCH